jgi:hypothetical protein
MKTEIKNIGLLVGGVVIGVVVGFSMARHGITLYRHDGFRTVVHNDWPTYGLPLVEYTSILSLIEKQDTDKAKKRLNMFLDQSVQDAMDRYEIVSGREREEIRKALTKAAEYRQAYPRPPTTNDAPATVFWSSERQMKEDRFLSDLLNNKDQK